MRTKTSAEQLYEDHKKMIYKQAHSIHTLTGVELEELIREGHLCFMKCVRSPKRDPNRKFSAYLFGALRNELFHFAHKQINSAGADESVTDRIPAKTSSPAKIAAFNEMLHSLTDEAKYIVGILLGGPGEILELVGGESARFVRGALRKHLRQVGWSHPSIWKTFSEIKNTLREEV